jgi:hypothetical protein
MIYNIFCVYCGGKLGFGEIRFKGQAMQKGLSHKKCADLRSSNNILRSNSKASNEILQGRKRDV